MDIGPGALFMSENENNNFNCYAPSINPRSIDTWLGGCVLSSDYTWPMRFIETKPVDQLWCLENPLGHPQKYGLYGILLSIMLYKYWFNFKSLHRRLWSKTAWCNTRYTKCSKTITIYVCFEGCCFFYVHWKKKKISGIVIVWCQHENMGYQGFEGSGMKEALDLSAQVGRKFKFRGFQLDIIDQC